MREKKLDKIYDKLIELVLIKSLYKYNLRIQNLFLKR